MCYSPSVIQFKICCSVFLLIEDFIQLFSDYLDLTLSIRAIQCSVYTALWVGFGLSFDHLDSTQSGLGFFWVGSKWVGLGLTQ